MDQPESGNFEKLRYVWGRLRALGVPDSDLHEIVGIAQDLEVSRVCTVLRMLQETGAKRLPPEVVDIIRLIEAEFAAKGHRVGADDDE